jgi:hypothetical protein
MKLVISVVMYYSTLRKKYYIILIKEDSRFMYESASKITWFLSQIINICQHFTHQNNWGHNLTILPFYSYLDTLKAYLHDLLLHICKADATFTQHVFYISFQLISILFPAITHINTCYRNGRTRHFTSDTYNYYGCCLSTIYQK